MGFDVNVCSTLNWPLWLFNNPLIPSLLTPYHIPYNSCSPNFLPSLQVPSLIPPLHSQRMTSPPSLLRRLRPTDRSFFGFHLSHFHTAISNASGSQEDKLLHLAKIKLSASVLDPSPYFNAINNNNSSKKKKKVFCSRYGPHTWLSTEQKALIFIEKLSLTCMIPPPSLKTHRLIKVVQILSTLQVSSNFTSTARLHHNAIFTLFIYLF